MCYAVLRQYFSYSIFTCNVFYDESKNSKPVRISFVDQVCVNMQGLWLRMKQCTQCTSKGQKDKNSNMCRDLCWQWERLMVVHVKSCALLDDKGSVSGCFRRQNVRDSANNLHVGVLKAARWLTSHWWWDKLRCFHQSTLMNSMRCLQLIKNVLPEINVFTLMIIQKITAGHH